MPMQTAHNNIFTGPQPSIWPLSLSANKRYLVNALGTPFYVHGDSAWSLAGQLNRAQVDTYLNDRQVKGFNSVIFNAIEHKYTSQSPLYKNFNNDSPFTTIGTGSSPYTPMDFTTHNEPYWAFVDYIVNNMQNRGMAAFMNPCYWGFNNADEGWSAEVLADTTAHLQSYGSFLATRYNQGNVVWYMGVDTNVMTGPQLTTYWNIMTGIRSVRTNNIVSGEAWRTNDGYTTFNGQVGWNLNTIYTDGTELGYAATAYGRSGPIPFILGEGQYAGAGTTATVRRQAYATVLAGGCGAFFGQDTLWDFGSTLGSGGGAAAALSGFLTTTESTQQQYVPQLFTAYKWWLLVPKTDTSFVTTSQGTGATAIIPALASDGSFGMVWTPSVDFTCNMSVFNHTNVRGRWYDPTAGTFSTASGSPYSNTGTNAFTNIGERILVLD